MSMDFDITYIRNEFEIVYPEGGPRLIFRTVIGDDSGPGPGPTGDFQLVGYDFFAGSAITLTGTPRTIAFSSEGATITLPTPTLASKGQHWSLIYMPVDSVNPATVIGAIDVNEIPARMSLELVGAEVGGEYFWQFVGYLPREAITAGPGGGPIAISDVTDLQDELTELADAIDLKANASDTTSALNERERFRGAYSALTEYFTNDTVTYDGFVWISAAGTTGEIPGVGVNWVMTGLSKSRYDALVSATASASSLAGTKITSAEAETIANAAIATWVGAAPDALNTLVEIAAELENADDAIEALVTTMGTKADTSYVDSLIVDGVEVVRLTTPGMTYNVPPEVRAIIAEVQCNVYLPDPTTVPGREITIINHSTLYETAVYSSGGYSIYNALTAGSELIPPLDTVPNLARYIAQEDDLGGGRRWAVSGRSGQYTDLPPWYIVSPAVGGRSLLINEDNVPSWGFPPTTITYYADEINGVYVRAGDPTLALDSNVAQIWNSPDDPSWDPEHPDHAFTVVEWRDTWNAVTP